MLTKFHSALVVGFIVAIGLAGCSSSNQGTAKTTAPASPPAAVKNAAKAPQSRTTDEKTSLERLRQGDAAKNAEGSALKEIFFEFDRYDLTSDARVTLKGAADWLKKNPAAKVEIEGHCDERGTNEYNLALGAKRAQAAKDYLISLGVPEVRLSTTSYGEETPVCRENSEGCWQKNRRDRFVALNAKPGV